MWIDSLRDSRSQPLRIKWPEGQYTNLLYSANAKCQKNPTAKLVNISSGQEVHVSIYRKVTLIKSVLFSKLVYISAVLQTPTNT